MALPPVSRNSLMLHVQVKVLHLVFFHLITKTGPVSHTQTEFSSYICSRKSSKGGGISNWGSEALLIMSIYPSLNTRWRRVQECSLLVVNIKIVLEIPHKRKGWGGD